MRTEWARLLVALMLLMTASLNVVAGRKSPLPQQGIVPDEPVAVKIAEAIFPPIFGMAKTAACQPYHAELKDGVWTVYGTLKNGSRGGTPMMTIRKRDGRVIEVWHSQ